MPDFLKEMAKSSGERAAKARVDTPENEMRRAAEHMPPTRKLRFDGFGVIAEIKRAAPSTGELRAELDVPGIVRDYAGASAISVLTEPSRFNGDLKDLREARASSEVPVMRKDFLVRPYQLFEARANGADGVLLIAAILDDETLREMLGVCEYLGLFALVEAFSELDAERAQLCGAKMIGINCRDLRDLSVDFGRFERLRGYIDLDRTAVAESGITTPEQLLQVRELGYHAALIGSALMRDANPGAALQRLLGATQESTR
ncbi:MAG: indole-3-glycerol phosphate synthase TrpC [Planctomycetes bacterium]|nr:indole-3-glycerol phosphate synthase TrpC [Planctomycetota bacterium]